MSLPFSRNTTYGPGSVVKSGDLDDIQDCIIAAKHGEMWLPLGGSGGTYDNCKFLDGAGYVQNSGSPWACVVPLLVPPGTRVKNLRVMRQGNDTSSLNVRLRKVELLQSGPSVTIVKGVTVTNPSSTWTVTDLGLTSSDYVLTSRTVVLHLDVDGAGSNGTQRWAFPEVLVDRP